MWKILPILRLQRPDLTLLVLNAHTTGLLLIAGLDAGNTSLAEAYPELVRRYRPIAEPPAEVLGRHGAIPSSHPLVAELLQLLRQARQQQWSTQQIQAELAPFRQRIATAEVECCGRARELSELPCPLQDPPDPAAP